jgi:hypothetical protein
MNTKKLVPFLSFSLVVLLWLPSCSAPKTLLPGKSRSEPFSRVYPIPLKDFHPMLNQALQKYAQKKPGNTFQVVRLGNDMVVIRGYFQKEPQQGRLPVVITSKPGGEQRTRLEINPSAGQPGEPKAIAGELFRIIEKETGLTPLE